MNLLDGEVRVYGSTKTVSHSSLLALSAGVVRRFGAADVSSGFDGVCDAYRRPSVLPGPGMRLLFAHGLREVGVDLLWDALLQVLASSRLSGGGCAVCGIGSCRSPVRVRCG
jgi:hypothetical protein